MKVTRIIVLAVALGAGLIAAMLLMNMVGNKASAPQVVREVEEVPSEDVLVASNDIPIGKSVGPDDLRWQKWPAEGLSPSVITRSRRPDAITELSGGIARTPFLDGEPIKEQKLIRADAGFMSAILPKGRRAIAVQVSALNTAGGFILPNDRVDVVLTRQKNTGNDERAEWYSETILTNIRILAIDQKIEDKKNEKVVVARETATLELTPTQVEVVARAQQVGTLSLALRSIVDARPDGESDPVTKRRSGVNYVKFGLQSQSSSQ